MDTPEQAAEAPRDAERDAKRDAFIERLVAEHRHHVLEVGCGTGKDGLAFKAAGITYTGVDLSEAHVRAARAKHLEASVAAPDSLPFADRTFDAAWCLGTLTHVSNTDLYGVLDEILRVLKPGAPLAVGLRSGKDEERLDLVDGYATRRFLSLRSDETVLSLFEPHGSVKDFTTWEEPDQPGHYQYFILAKF
ncbi:methyltransferase type 11 [Arthrobacter crystallopoietes BAB-32]|uniref:Methyltransferase type 11 n=1 Tax=Arthrobacter crystallopoietes BAB-32 TaxID=1246476 RepID=N1UTJ6_9MICC|nr:class I SAM-dependent methyltransferase [Arthrobacter crystallopoietes]EMY32380.1 methyltransferase type 11 [Arthrobacter crystallopoietes BAB-32]